MGKIPVKILGHYVSMVAKNYGIISLVDGMS